VCCAQYCNIVARLAENANDTIWIQNYHLLVLPSFLRKKLPHAKIGFFIHTVRCDVSASI